ncbi:MAG: N-acetyl-gamma-glutamyl-phosphate reductase, partial [Proteobacteria bacterium]|nr:N-acetyl-gamma-glutamyl-phosphate reductase [Pseudomonadota bacterium]
MTVKVFIDGEAGTTGLQIRARLAAHPGVELLSLPEDRRKDRDARLAMFEAADLAVLCLPDEAAREAAAMIGGIGHIRLIDASSAHRTDDDWAYGFPEYDDAQSLRI